MIFYTPKNDEGRTILCTTQADSDKIQKGAAKIDVPVDKAGLKATLQDSIDTIFSLQGQINSAKHDASIAPVTIPDAEPAPAPVPMRANTSYEATEIEDFILNRASVAQVENLFGCLGNRFAELRTKG